MLRNAGDAQIVRWKKPPDYVTGLYKCIRENVQDFVRFVQVVKIRQSADMENAAQVY